MMSCFYRWNNALIISIATVFLISATLCGAAVPPLELMAVSDAVRVFEDGYGFTNNQSQVQEINVFGLRSETISAQCVVRAGRDLPKLTATLTPLKKAGSSAQIPVENLTWRFVTDILVLTNTPRMWVSDLTRPAPARFPDCLSEDRQCAVTNGALKAIYLTLRIPADAEPGEYRGSLKASSDGAAATLPITLNVYPLTMPEQRHLLVVEWMSTRHFKKFHGVESEQSDRYWQILRAYAKNMVEHRHNTFKIGLSLIKTTVDEKGNYNLDFSEFDRYAQVFWETGLMDAMETGFVARHVPGGWSSPEIKIYDFFTVYNKADGKAQKVPGEAFLAKFLPLFVNHLREKKWLDKTLFHICDEPANHNITHWRKASEFVHRHAPELRRIDAIETPHCLDRLEVWVPKLDHLSTWQGAFEEAQRRGNELWFYTVGIYQGGALMNKTVDVPLIDTRLMHWLNYRYQLKGYLHWGFNAWTDDPWEAPGLHRGDGWHVYPKQDGLLDSLRWEQMRDGLQDYECLWLLEDKIRQIAASLSPQVAKMIEPARRGQEIASRVVRSYTDFSRDPQILYAARRQAIEETLAMDAAPRIILQTFPPEHSVMARNCAIDVHGWVEPGTQLKINGGKTAVPVADDGSFFARAHPSRTTGIVEFEAENAKGERKTFTRSFRLQTSP